MAKKVVKKEKRKNDFMHGLFSALIAALIIRQFLVQAYTIPTGSMEQTLLKGDFLLVNKYSYGMRSPHWLGIPYTQVGFSVPWFRFPAIQDPKPYDVIIFQYPKDPNVDYIKRCIAVGGQSIEIKDKEIFIDKDPFPIPPKMQFIDKNIRKKSRGRFSADQTYLGLGSRDNYGPFTIPANHYWAMGDNRDNSLDSRYWGPVPHDLMVGKGLVIYFSWGSDTPWSEFYNKIRWNRIGWVIR